MGNVEFFGCSGKEIKELRSAGKVMFPEDLGIDRSEATRERLAAKNMAGLVARARAAQKIAEGYDQERVSELCEAVSFAACNEEFRRTAARMLVEESKMGVEEDKSSKIRNKAMGVYRDMKGVKSVGIIESDSEKQLATYCKPMGVIGAITPVTNGEAACEAENFHPE